MGRRSLTLAALLVATLPGAADQLALTDGGRLSGEVVSMAADGTLTIRADVAVDPLALRPDRIRRVDFGGASPTFADHDARIQLVNDDVIPCEVLAIDSERLKVRTSFAGDLDIPRSVVRRVQLGIRPRKLLLAGIADDDGWKVQGDAWAIVDGALVSADNGFAGRLVEDLPPSFSLAFSLKWEQRPSFKVFFCSEPDKGTGGKLDRYFLQFNSAGFELKRQSTGQTSYQGLGVINRGPETFAKQEVRVELRVDRAARMIYLYLDGELEGRFPDQLDGAPKDSGIVFESGAKLQNGHRVSDLEVRLWDASGDRHKSEERGNENVDAVIDHDGQRFSGSLLETAVRDGETVVLFQSPHLDDPLAIPLARISTLFLAGTSKPPAPSPLYFGLGANGRLSGAGGRFDDRKIELDHPLLGALNIDRTAVASLERRETGKEEEP